MSLNLPISSVSLTDVRAVADDSVAYSDAHNRRVHVAVCLGVGVWSGVFTAFYIAVGAPILLVSVMAVCTLGGIGVTLAARRGMNLRVATAWTMALMFGVCTTIPFFYGGVNFSGNAWLLVIPITAASMRSQRIAVVSTIGLCVVLGISLVLGELDLLPEPLFSSRVRGRIAAINLVVIGVLSLTIGRLHFLRLRARTERVQAVNQLLLLEVERRKQTQSDLERTRSELMLSLIHI